MKAAVYKKIEQAKTRDTIGRNLAPCIITDNIGSQLWDTQMSTGSNHSTKLTPVILVDKDGKLFVLQYVITSIVATRQFEEAFNTLTPDEAQIEEGDEDDD